MDEAAGRGSSARAFLTGLQDKNNECAQCAESGIAVSAAGFCRTCSDFLCTSCIDQHKILRATKHHELLEDENTLNQKRAASDEAKCAVHPNTPIQAYCKDDDIFGCLECFVVGHRECKNVGLLSKLSQGVDLSEEFLDVHKAAERCKTLEEQYRLAIQKCLSMNEIWHTITLGDFKKFRSKLLSMVDEIGENISKEADTLKEDNERQLRDLAKQVTTYTEQAKRYLLTIKEKKASKNNEQMFLVMKTTGRDLTYSVHHMETLYQDIRIKAFNFSSDPTMTACLNNIVKISLEVTPFLSEQLTKVEEKDGYRNTQTGLSVAERCTSMSKVNIKSPEDINDCWVIGMIELSPTQLILSDYNNNCLKLVDLTTNSTIIKRRTLAAQPWDITALPEGRLAVSMPFLEKIQIFTADQSLDPCESINVSGECRGIYCTGDQYVVSFISPECQIQILDLTGNVLRSIKKYGVSTDESFKRPLFLTLSPENNLIYVSDNHKNTVTCIETTGTVRWVYQDQDFMYPRGVCTGTGGSIYVCNTNTIHVISSDGSNLDVMQSSQSGESWGMCYSRYDRTMYVSSVSSEDNQRNYISKLNMQ